jgi:FKBP-type peptidyl-prolyl cis-trans isomerase SlyD
MQVENDTVVTIRYIMNDDKGEVKEDMMNISPVQYVHGNGNILPFLELQVEGLSAGDKRSFVVKENLWKNPFHLDVEIDDVRATTIEEIENGHPFIKDCGPGCGC